jgi:hypothetical protein
MSRTSRTNTLPFGLFVCVTTDLLAQAFLTAPRQEPKATTWSDPSPHKSGLVTANGIRLHYLDWGGSGPALIFVHGLGENRHYLAIYSASFTGQAPRCEYLEGPTPDKWGTRTSGSQYLAQMSNGTIRLEVRRCFGVIPQSETV